MIYAPLRAPKKSISIASVKKSVFIYLTAIAKVKGYATDDIAKASNKIKLHRQTSKQLEHEAAR